MASISEIIHKGKSILFIDASGFKVHDDDALLKFVEQAKQKIRSYPPKSLLIITDVTNSQFDTGMAETFKEFGKHNTPYVKASAVVGLSGLQKIIFIAIKTVTGREFYVAKSIEDAKEWVIRQ